MKQSKKILKETFSFLFQNFNFEIINTSFLPYATYAKFSSNLVEINLIYEFRERVPDVLFTLKSYKKFENRPGLYSLIDLYKSPEFELYSFYFDEIMRLYKQSSYKEQFNTVNTTDEALSLISEQIKDNVMSFVKGEKVVYDNMEIIYRERIKSLSTPQ